MSNNYVVGNVLKASVIRHRDGVEFELRVLVDATDLDGLDPTSSFVGKRAELWLLPPIETVQAPEPANPGGVTPDVAPAASGAE